MYFKSLAILDLETTGLQFPKITEIALVACSRSNCENDNKIPRVLEKLTICVNPNDKIHPTASLTSGLDNFDLMNLSRFDHRVWEILERFLRRLVQPVCLVAHNGIKFDFPILKKELRNCGVVNFEGLYCADSLLAFREIFPRKREKLHSLLSNTEEDMECLAAVEESEAKGRKRESIEETPCRLDPLLLAPKKQKPNVSRLIHSTARRKLRFTESASSNCSKTEEPLKFHFDCRGAPKDYSLSSIFEFLHGYYFNDAHRAEVDAMALLRCMVKVGAICHWIDKNAVSFNDISESYF